MGLWELSTDDGSTYTDFDDLFFYVASSTGTGMLPVLNLASALSQQPGASYDKTSINERPFALQGSFNTDGTATKLNFHSRKQSLLRAFNANAATVINARPAPIILKYTGATADKIIHCYYEGGFEDSSPAGNAFSHQGITLRFVAYDPFFYATSETSQVLDSKDAATFTTVGAKIDGVWDNLGPPDASGTYGQTLAVASDDTYIYFGGTFTNFDNIASADRIVRMNISTQVYTALDSGLNGTVRDMIVAANGDLYVVGDFTNAGGVANADYITVWDGSAWAAVGNPNSGGASILAMYGIAIDTSGNMYVGGNFTNLAGIANADMIAMWDGSSWTALGTGAALRVRSIAASTSNNIYACGDFVSMGGVSNTNFIAKWNGTAWEEVGGGVGTGTITHRLLLTDVGNLYLCGILTAVGGITVSNIALWNGTVWADVGGGTDGVVYSLTLNDNGLLYVGGNFSTVGSSSQVSDGLAAWNGSVWVRPDINLSGTPIIFDSVFDSNGDLYIGFDTDGSANYAGSTTEEYAGTAVSYGYITVNRDGGTFATLQNITNATTGAVLYFDHDLLDGETLTIEMRQNQGIGVTSDFGGALGNQPLPSSTLGDFFLTPGRSGTSKDNVITAWVTTGGATNTVTLYYTAAYLSQD